MFAKPDILGVENHETLDNTSFCIKTTSYGGRGVFSTRPISENTRLLVCKSPYASVLYRDFRKEVCGFCFAYVYDFGRGKSWPVKVEADLGVWFCADSCKTSWEEENVGGLLGLVSAAFESAIKKMRKARSGDVCSGVDVAIIDELTLDVLDTAWKSAEIISHAANAQRTFVHLDEMELVIARFVSSGIVMRYIEDSTKGSSGSPSHSWSNFFQLQNNELLHIRCRPYVLNIHIHIYQFLRIILPVELRAYLTTSETVRAILGRDPGNSFGVWQNPPTDESEMFGWAIYPSASFFNHSTSLHPFIPPTRVFYSLAGCVPNVRKERIGRAFSFYTVKDVQAGEELCISYVSTDEGREERRRKLSEKWYFDCSCVKCENEGDMPAN